MHQQPAFQGLLRYQKVFRFFLLVSTLFATVTAGLQAAPKPIVEKTSYQGFEAYRLSDGTTEAVVVPSLSARVLRYGKIGGSNWLWNGVKEKTEDVWANWGGDKTFIGPHSLWKLGACEIWPPQYTWDGASHRATVLAGGRLRTVGPAWPTFEISVTREFSFNRKGEFVIVQTLEKHKGEPLFASIWSVSQANTPDAVFLPLHPQTAYPHGFAAFGAFPKENVNQVLPSLLQISPAPGAAYKLGADSHIAAIGAVKNGVFWLQRAGSEASASTTFGLAKNESPPIYPEGQNGKPGFPVEFYNHSDAGSGHYVELELLSPMRAFKPGLRWTHTVRWSLHPLPSGDVNAAATRQKISALFNNLLPRR